MKRLITFALMATCLVISCSKFDDSAIWDKLNDHENRIAYLEEVCKKMNNDIVNLQTLVTALETNDYIVNASPLATGDGYTFIFKSGKSVVIYNGKDGKDGTDGKDGIDGKDGVIPTIGVMKDVDGVYYWTVNGEWLLVNGQKVKASATDGKDGEDGIDGVNGANGKDGITPKFKIEEDYWYVSYDNGQSWEKLGKATGNNGLDGINGEDGDSIFQKVTQDDKYVYFYLSDGTMITLSKHNTDIIQFEDLNVKAICCKKWDTNNDGELSYKEAAAVKEMSGFMNNANIIAFTELKYFTNLETIKPYAFSQCTSLWKINFPESLKVIGQGAFNGCTSLLNVTIPQSVNTIESSTFAGCNNIKTLTIESNELLTIGDNAFYRCGGILNINCDIPSNSFNSSYFTEVIVGDKVTTIGTEAFAYCDSLSSVSFGSNVLEISQKAFRSCDQLISVIIPDKVTTIGTEAFAYCNSLCELTIGSSVTKIGGSAFMTSNYSNNPLVTVYIKALTPPSIGAYALYVKSGLNSSNTYYYKVPSNMKIYVPTSSVYTYKSQWTNYADNIVGYTF